ncbi:MAG: hypothetical protein ABIX10_00340 [Acidimicrobiales bacterium]
MNTRREVLRRIAGVTTRTGAAASAAMALLSVVGLSVSGLSPAAAATAGTAEVVYPSEGAPTDGQPLDAGGSTTAFSLSLPTGAACTGDSANAGYRVQSYMVPDSVDPNTLTFDLSGPIPTAVGADFRQPLFDPAGTPYTEAQTANATVQPGPGPIVNVPAFDYHLFSPGNIPAGDYNIGIACTKGPASDTQLDKFWNVRVAFAADAADQPAQIAWTVSGDQTTTTTTEGGSTTTTTEGGSTTTTTGDGSTTTSAGDGSTTTTVADGSTSTTTASFVADGGSPSGTAVAGSLTGLPVTGSSPLALLLWSVLLLLCGRAAVLLARPPRARPEKT